MYLDLDVSRRRVVVIGTCGGVRRVVKRYAAAGAAVTAVLDSAWSVAGAGPQPVHRVRLPGVEDQAALLRVLVPAWLVVVVDPPNELAERIRWLCARMHLLQVDEPAASDQGCVTLVGGGPGRTGLVTRDGLTALREADVVFYDRLGPVEDLSALAPAAELVDVGKSPYHHPVSQTSIEEQLVARARDGLSVVRLKGGDPFVLGRGGEELLACIEADIPVRVIPGVSSAIAVPGSAGIPVTHRGITRSFTVISGHVPPSAVELSALARLGGTIVILMGLANLNQIAVGLITAGLPAATPAAVVERGYSEQERTVLGSLGELPAEVRRMDVQPPAVIVIGEVVSLAHADREAVLAGIDALAPKTGRAA